MATDIIARGMAASGVHVGADGKIPADLLPSYVDDIEDLIAVSSTAPTQCSEGDKYYNTTTKLIYTATGTNTWGTDGETPVDGKIYVDASSTPSKSYRWSGSDFTLVSTVIENLVDGTGTASLKQTSATAASGNYSVALGDRTTASGHESFAAGFSTIASKEFAIAMGNQTQATKSAAVALGDQTQATNDGAFAEGRWTEASGECSHAEGLSCEAQELGAHAEGKDTKAKKPQSHAEGLWVEANGNQQHAQGKYNIPDTTSAHILGNGTNWDALSNAHTIDWSGNAWFEGDVYVGSTSGTNKDAGSKKLATEDYANGVIPQKATLPTAVSTNEGVIYQFTGTTDANYTNGYFYKCVSDGATPAPTYTWERIDTQPGGTASTDLYVLDHTQYTDRTIILKGLKKGIYCWDDGHNLFSFKWDTNSPQNTSLQDRRCIDGLFIVLKDISESEENNSKLASLYFYIDNPFVTRYMCGYIYKSTDTSGLSYQNHTDVDLVGLTTTQNISGKKTFLTLPETSITPTTANQLVNKKYVDDSILVKTYELSGLSAYSNASTYAVDDYVYYNNLIYKCNTAVTTPENFDSQKWTQKTYIEYMTDVIIGSALTQNY